MIIGVVLDLAVGALCIVLGVLVWGKRMLSVLHDYHYKNVKQEDIPAYTRQIGLGLILIGCGCVGMGVLNLVSSPFWWLPMALGFVLGLTVMLRAQKKYNGSVLG